MQGFKHKDVLESKLDTESYDLSSRQISVGSDGMLQKMAYRYHGCEGKSIFLQSDHIHQKVEIYGEPSANKFKFLANQVLQMSEHHGNGGTWVTRP